MKYILFFLVVFQCFGIMHAQDTTVVQTITYDNIARAGNYIFPNDDTSYRKILMLYNMRCKGDVINQSGGNDVGCGEWDYSCNTFITDSSRVDFRKATHPDYTITGDAGDGFEYSTDQSFSRFSFEQINTSITSSEDVSAAEIGSGGTFSMDLSEGYGRAQQLFTAEELANQSLPEGVIRGISLEIEDGGDFVNFLRIGIKATDVGLLDSGNPDLEGFTTVYFSNTNVTTSGEQRLLFFEEFEWDGESNIVLDISYGEAGSTNEVSVNAHTLTSVRSIFTDGDDSCILLSGKAMDISAPEMNSVSDEISVAFWAYGDESLLPSNTSIVEAVDGNNSRQVNIHLPWSDGVIYWDCGNDGSGYDRINKAAPESAIKGQWNYWVFTKNATTGSMKIYLNGNLWHSGTGKKRPIDINQFVVGTNLGESYSYFGKLDDLSIWNVELTAENITNYMNRPITNGHPQYDGLVRYFDMQEGTGNNVSSIGLNSDTETLENGVNWSALKGNELFKNFMDSDTRFNTALLYGDVQTSNVPNEVIWYEPNPKHVVSRYEVEGTSLVLAEQFDTYPAGEMDVVNENGDVVDTYFTPIDGTININTLEYLQERVAKYEILSLVTPYGIGLDLGETGKTFVFDVTDYGPILKGNKRISMELGGQRQEEIDIKFLFIEGTPAQEVMDIRNIWPFERAWYDEIQDEKKFEERTIDVHPNADQWVVQSSVTGHGQNGEFVARDHFINLDGEIPEFSYRVWKKCGENPIYPQGGTWIYDRAGWCPGQQTDIHRFDITEYVAEDHTATIDYGLFGNFMNQANYLVSNQIISYGSPNFDTDADVVEIIKPSNRVEYERFNPICSNPEIMVKNGGSNTITSLKIMYEVLGSGDTRWHDWEGNIPFQETETITLPISSHNFFATENEDLIFRIRIIEVNGAPDQNQDNDSMEVPFSLPLIIDSESEDNFAIRLRTNNQPNENSYTVRDLQGNVIIERSGLTANTTYEDAIDFGEGCFSIELIDTDGDGLSFWADPGAGTGNFSIRRLIGVGNFALKSYETEFGSFLKIDFLVGSFVVGTEDEIPQQTRLVSIYPNPAEDNVNIDLFGYEDQVSLELRDVQGRLISKKIVKSYDGEMTHASFDLNGRAQGMYLVQIKNGNKIQIKKFVKI